MSVIHHHDRPLMEFPQEPWRSSLRVAVNRSAGANTLSVWTHDIKDKKRAPLHYHDVEEVVVYIEVE